MRNTPWLFAVLAAVIVLATGLVLYYLGDFQHTVYRECFMNIEVRIVRDGNFPDFESLDCEIWRHNERIVGPVYLGLEPANFEFKSITVPNKQIIAVYEVHRPHVVLVAFDVRSGTFWPRQDIPMVEAIRRGDEMLGAIRSATGDNRYELGDLTTRP